MNQKKELIKNTIIISLGKFSTQIASFLLLPLYTSLLTTSEYGEYDLLNTISIFLIPCVTLLMEEGMFRFLIDAKDKKDKTEIFSQTVIFSIFSFIIWGLLIFVTGKLFHYSHTNYLILYILASILSSIAGSSCRGLSKFKLYSLFSFASSFLNILLNVVFIAVLKLGLSSLFLSYIISNSLVSLWLIFKLDMHKYVRFKNINKTKMQEMIKYSFPLVPNSISWSAISLSARLIITYFIGSGANGIYSVSNRFPSIINTCYSFFNLSWKESASKALNQEDKDNFYNSVYINLKRFLLCVSLLIIAILPFIFNLLVAKNYREAYYYIPLMIIAVYFSNLSNFCSGIFSAYKDTKVLAMTTIYAAIVNIIIGISLINKLGILASVIGALVAYFIIYIYRNYKLRKYIILKKDRMNIISTLVLILIVILYYTNNYSFFTIGLLIAIGYSYYLNKAFINVILQRFKKRGN